MVSANLRYLSSLPGLCKLATIFMVMVAISLAGHAYENSLYNIFYNLIMSVESHVPELKPFTDQLPGLGRERFFLAIVGIIFIVSFLLLFCHVLNDGFEHDQKVKLGEIVFHALGALCLIIVGSLIIASSRKINKDVCHFEDNVVPTTESALLGGDFQFIEEEDEEVQELKIDPGKLAVPHQVPLLESVDLDSNPGAFFRSKLSVMSQFKRESQLDELKCQYRAEKEVAGTFAILGCFLYAFLAVILFLRLNSSPPPVPSANGMMHEVVL